MKLEDKTIELITAIFDKEIAELEEEIRHAAEDALNAVKSETVEAEDEITDEQPITVKELMVDEAAEVEQPVVDNVKPSVENEPVVDEEVTEEPPVVDENPEPVAEDPSEEPAATEPVTEQEPEPESDLPEEHADEEPAEEQADEEPADEHAEVVEDIDPVPEDTDAPVSKEEPADEPAPAPASAKGSSAKAVLSALGYLLAVAVICVLSVVAMNLLDRNLQNMKPEIPQDIPQSNLAASLQTYTANEVFAQQAVQQPSLQQIYAMDLRKPSGATEADLKRVSKAGLVGLEDTFLQAEKQYGVNAIFLMSIASLESAHGTMMYRPNNMFGYGGKSYPSKEACIMDVASGLSSKYLKPGASLYGGSPTLSGVNKRYAANPQWYAKVGKYMKSYYDVIAPYHNQNLNKIK